MAERVVIIGSGPSGQAAAIYAARASLEPLCIEGQWTQENFNSGRPPLGQLMITTEVENYPGFPAGNMESYLKDSLGDVTAMLPPHSGHGVSGPELMQLMRKQAGNFGTRFVGEDVIEVDFSSHPFKLKTTAQEVEALSVIISTGARANYLGLDSEQKFKNMGVSACAVCDGALPRFTAKPLVVVGGGDSAMEEASYLTKFGSTVYIVHRRDKFRASKIMAQRVLDNPKVQVKWNSSIDEVLGNETDGVTGVRLRNTADDTQTEELDCSGYFAAIGHTPNTEFLKGHVDMNEKGYILWPKSFRTDTSVDGVFAAGDCADDNYRQAITAAGTGCMAALDAERWLAANGFE
jgi:thioredoxin reductase (NADPH)